MIFLRSHRSIKKCSPADRNVYENLSKLNLEKCIPVCSADRHHVEPGEGTFALDELDCRIEVDPEGKKARYK